MLLLIHLRGVKRCSTARLFASVTFGSGSDPIIVRYSPPAAETPARAVEERALRRAELIVP